MTDNVVSRSDADPMTESVPGEEVKLRVVIVDDHQMFVEAITHVLEMQPDIEVVGTAGTAVDGLALGALEPDVAILDLKLPDGDGTTLCQRLRDARPWTHVLILSGASDERSLVASIDAGCAGFLTKDRAADELVTAIRVVAGGESYVQSTMLAHLLPRVRRAYHRLGDDLTAREREILGFLADGLSNREIAEQLIVSVHTVRNHVQGLLGKLNAHSKLEAVAIANREGIIRRTD